MIAERGTQLNRLAALRSEQRREAGAGPERSRVHAWPIGIRAIEPVAGERADHEARVARAQHCVSEPEPTEHAGPELLEHEYDGIREYDNPTPAWWHRATSRRGPHPACR